MIRLDDKTTCEAIATCTCGKQVWFELRHEINGPNVKHELPACDLFVKSDSDDYRRRILGAAA